MSTLANSQRKAILRQRAKAAHSDAAVQSNSTQHRFVSVFVSVVVHSVILLVMALFVYQRASDSELVSALEVNMEPLPEVEVTTLADISLEKSDSSPNNSATSKASREALRLASASEPPPVRVAFHSPHGILPSSLPKDGNGFGGEALTGLGESGGVALAGNDPEETGDGEIGFFGTKAKGKSFVFIVDCSGSMRMPTTIYEPRQPLVTRFLRARQELLSSLEQLSPDQTYYVIFYNHQTFPMFYPQPAKRMIPATTEFLDLSGSWIQSVVPGGGTDPREAFRIALALRPEVIFFLTDGIIPPVTRIVAKNNNKSRTRIHTIAFGLPDNQDTLIGIAQDNQGRFRFVP